MRKIKDINNPAEPKKTGSTRGSVPIENEEEEDIIFYEDGEEEREKMDSHQDCITTHEIFDSQVGKSRVSPLKEFSEIHPTQAISLLKNSHMKTIYWAVKEVTWKWKIDALDEDESENHQIDASGDVLCGHNMQQSSGNIKRQRSPSPSKTPFN
ncbi:hypothetical protein BpHYR1_015611 [Brachionus plicatilis]|uniref:Uncharacterized protein n=1 Tax=Brachionus plicatilis TaxID=10195 RepID=A0A3M7PRH0_BRAPC|nr:hypothetical protein BpHYR1_015611 [Brachionus plicatilis]